MRRNIQCEPDFRLMKCGIVPRKKIVMLFIVKNYECHLAYHITTFEINIVNKNTNYDFIFLFLSFATPSSVKVSLK